ncbi:hypothetical protein M3223_17075 [Paenibacillus pasadenensis]|uniref:hypothetical protein n=1 Tax=Paenibacillus pasadenensis TaxID=217090 RepID=UPI00203F9D6D|nr:hypothetical protein [Paenibacillus pasadenensis]MCM3749071.1 hypothetical protein [Paenibacillus pasadenensis]
MIEFNGESLKDNEMNIINTAKKYSETKKWSIVEHESNYLLLSPHPKCESLEFDFTSGSKFEGSIKTIYAPESVHIEIVDLFIELKKLTKYLELYDVSGKWDNEFKVDLSFELNRFFELSTKIEKNFKLTKSQKLMEGAPKGDIQYWTEDYHNDFLDSDIIKHILSENIRDSIYLMSSEELHETLTNKHNSVIGLYPINYQDNFFHFFVHMAFLWAWEISNVKGISRRKNNCIAFASALYDGICGEVLNGYVNKKHKNASDLLLEIYKIKGAVDQDQTIEILLSLAVYCEVIK